MTIEVMYYCYQCCDEGWNYSRVNGIYCKVPCFDNCLRGKQWKEKQEGDNDVSTQEKAKFAAPHRQTDS